MGCFLAIGLRLTAAIRKKDIDHRQDGVTLEDVLDRVANECHLGSIYDMKEEDGYFVYTVKKEILDEELMPFLKKFYSLRYLDDQADSSYVLEDLEKLPDMTSRLAILENKSYQTYQEGDEFCYYRIKGLWDDVRLSCHNAILSIDGKIIMECYNDVFKFFRRCIIAQMPEFKLSQALSVWIDG